jgi:hypothetical protein
VEISPNTIIRYCWISRGFPRKPSWKFTEFHEKTLDTTESRDTAEFRERLTRYYRIPRKNHGYPSFTWRYLRLDCLEISPFGAIGDISIGVIRNPAQKEMMTMMFSSPTCCIAWQLSLPHLSIVKRINTW